MNEKNVEGISKALDVDYEEKETPKNDMVKKIDSLPVSKERLDKDLGNDYKHVRGNLRDLIDVGQDAIDGILSNKHFVESN